MDGQKLPRVYLDRYSGATSKYPDLHPTDIPKAPSIPVIPVSESPERKPSQRPWYSPFTWTRRRTFISILVTIVIILVIVVPIEVVRANRYPDYSPLNYTLKDSYAGPSFFDHFNYFTEPDPTDGFVVYVNKETATNLNLTHASDTSAILRVDTVTPNALSGRNSVRIESKKAYNTGLFIFDIIHTPHGCGTWPALWMTDGANWPANGEIDILEATNEASHGNEISLHTTPGCSMKVKRKETGNRIYKTCDNSTNGNSGCVVVGEPETYGAALNQNGGGIYALELRNAGIRAWFFPRTSIPSDITSKTPDPSTWGTALADFPSTECDIPSHFQNLNIVANIDLCGELASQPQYYDQLYGCPSTCTDFVARNPSAFSDAYWEFRKFEIYHALNA
ncbi:Concanavalin A-like lectin/glucanase subgroup [Penicillium maclennaniae]|uniref:Concanavalin A-like lectin/glucanase subgroup n=1 Tax=Penicillium maclennaniae TaxID=1343394 RepID=UPI0025403313|nr:Concanavalin A-like lectin/glucanase subgroup [Penicillium maclennaniae]KAJ5664942.1 Concanavalin A-like lectin/glucanase subgroup [Penicillium maclennaniae]